MAKKEKEEEVIIGGSKKEQKSFDFTNYIGFFKGFVTAINPTKSELNKLLGKEDTPEDKELEYTGEKDGVKTQKITFWLSVEGKDGVYIPKMINLRNEIRRNKDGDKIQLVNCVGDDTWVEANNKNEFDESGLWESFKNFTRVDSWKLPNGEITEKYEKGAKPNETTILGKKRFRPALIGESTLLNFMKAWLGGIDLRETDANLLIPNMKDIFNGKVKQLTNLMNSEFEMYFTALAYVKVDEDNPDRQYQKVADHYLPPSFTKFINNGNKFKNAFDQSRWDKFLGEVEGEYGIDGTYVLEPLKEYDPKEDVATSKETKKTAPTATNDEY